MNEMFSQGGKGSTGILTNKQAVARHFGIKQSEVVYFSVGALLTGYKVIYDKETQRAYSLPADIGSGVTAVSLSPAGVLVHSAGNVDLAALAVTREEYVTLPGSFETGVTVNAKNELVVFTDGKYRWDGELPKVVDAASSPETSGGIASGAWVSVGDAALRSQISDPDGASSYPELQMARWRDEGDVRGWGAPTDGVTVCDAYFQAAETANKPLYVPVGMWRISTPMALGQKAQYYGPGVLVFDNAEWWRRGGSSGSLSVNERYTLFYDYPDKTAVTLTYDGASVPFTWVDDRTIEAAGTADTVNVKINIAKGYLRLGPVAETIRSYNLCGNGGGGEKLNPQLPDPLTSPTGYDNTSFGPRAMKDMVDGVNNTAIGSKALMSNKTGNNNTAVGFLALYRSTGQGNTAFGSVAGEWMTTGSYNCFFGLSAAEKQLDGRYNVAIGYEAMSEATSTTYSVAIGYRANANTGNDSQSNSVNIGAFSGDFSIGSNNTHIGYRAGNNAGGATAPGTGTGHDNTFVGMFAARYNAAGSESVVVGAGAATTATRVQGAVVIGFGACGNAATLGDFTTAIGWNALRDSTGTNNVAVGQQALLANTSGTGNVAVGSGALVANTTGINNSALGNNSGRLTQAGGPTNNLNNTTTIGNDARVSGDNQVQIGNGATTTYVYGTVQNRSDLRDKADIRDTKLGIDFILGLRPVDGRWDLRDDYVEAVEKKRTVQVPVEKEVDGELVTVMEDREETYIAEVIQHSKDGSKKRKRFHHWFIAQEVEELCNSLGVEFGGLQHHSVNGGEDKYTLGYDEFIPPIVKALQEIHEVQQDILKRLDALEVK